MLNYAAAIALFNALSVMGWCTYNGHQTTIAGQTCSEPGYVTVYETLVTGDNPYCPSTSKYTIGCECSTSTTVAPVVTSTEEPCTTVVPVVTATEEPCTTEVAPIVIITEEPCTTEVVSAVVYESGKECHDCDYNEKYAHGKKESECHGDECGHKVEVVEAVYQNKNECHGDECGHKVEVVETVYHEQSECHGDECAQKVKVEAVYQDKNECHGDECGKKVKVETSPKVNTECHGDDCVKTEPVYEDSIDLVSSAMGVSSGIAVLAFLFL